MSDGSQEASSPEAKRPAGAADGSCAGFLWTKETNKMPPGNRSFFFWGGGEVTFFFGGGLKPESGLSISAGEEEMGIGLVESVRPT